MKAQVREIVEWTGIGLDCLGVVVIVIGVTIALGSYVIRFSRSDEAYKQLRHNLGRAILLGLEVLVAADIIRTVAVDPTLLNVGVLGLIVLVRTFLSFALQVELEGRWPWQQSTQS